MSWSDVGCTDPVGNDAAEFERLAGCWRTASDTARSLSITFDGIVADSRTIGFEGKAAVAFQQIVAESADVLKDVPEVCGQLASVLSAHARELRRLRAEADAALARARTAWNDRSQSNSAANQAHGRAERIRRQIRSLQCYPPEQVAAQVQTLRYNLGVEERNASNHEYNATVAGRRLSRELENRSAYERDVSRRDLTTEQIIRNLDLRSLKDPNTLEQLGAAIGNAFQIVQDIGGALIAGANRVLWVAREVLDIISMALTMTMVVLAVAVLIFPPLGVALAPALAALALATAVAAGLKLGATTILVATRATNPYNPGQQLGVVDLALDGVDAGLALLGFGAARKARMAINLLPHAAPVAREVGRKVIIGAARDTVVVKGFEAVNNVTRPQSGATALSRLSYGSEPDQSRPATTCLRRQTSAVRSLNRGLVAPCRPRLLPCGVGGGL